MRYLEDFSPGQRFISGRLRVERAIASKRSPRSSIPSPSISMRSRPEHPCFADSPDSVAARFRFNLSVAQAQRGRGCSRYKVFKEILMFHTAPHALKFYLALGGCVAVAICAGYITSATAQSAQANPPGPNSVFNSTDVSPIYGVTIPAGYRDWKLISVNRLATDKLDQLRAQFGNDIAIKAFQEGILPFPDGAIIAAVHWNNVPSEANDKVLLTAFPGAQSFIAGRPVNVQFMVKDSKKYAATGGWGFGDFKDGKPGDEALHQTCFACHLPAKDHDFVFAHYAATP
jgi:Cytochrome P460